MSRREVRVVLHPGAPVIRVRGDGGRIVTEEFVDRAREIVAAHGCDTIEAFDEKFYDEYGRTTWHD